MSADKLAPLTALIILRIRNELEAITDPAERALVAHQLTERLPLIGGAIRTLRAQALQEAHAGRTWAELGESLKVSRQRAEQLARP